MVRYTGNVPVTLCTPLDHQHGLLPEVIAQQAVELMMTEGLSEWTELLLLLRLSFSRVSKMEEYQLSVFKSLADLKNVRTGN